MNGADHLPFLDTIPRATIILAGDSMVYPFLKNWIDQLLHNGDYKSRHFSEAAFCYQMTYGRQALIQFMQDHRNEINAPQNELLLALHEQVNLTIVDIGTLASFHQALAGSTKPFQVITGEIDLAYIEKDKALVFQLAGDLSTPLNMVLHECDLVEWEQKNLRLLRQLSEQILATPVIWVGGNPGDPLFQQWRRLLIGNSDGFSQPQIVIPPDYAPLDYEDLWVNDDVEFIKNKTDITAATSRVLELIAEKRHSSRTTLDVDTLRKRPYKFLDYFSEADREFFFGREAKIKSLYANVANFPMLFLYGPSGVGKTSLLRAGLRPRLTDNGVKSVYLTIGLGWQDLKRDLEQIHNGMVEQPLVLIVDQAEELFTRSTTEEREAAFNEMEMLLSKFKPHIHVVLSFREDFLGNFLGWSQSRLPVYVEHARLAPLSPQEARQAIEKPAEKVGVKIEASVVDGILYELDNDGIMPSQLQIVCDRLYDQRDLANVIRTRHYETVGRASGVLRDYLQLALQRFKHEQQQDVQAVLQALVTPEGWRKRCSKYDVQERTGLHLGDTEWLLAELVQSRLVRSVEQAGDQYFELAHDLLAANLLEWIDTGKQRALEISQLLDITGSHAGIDSEISKDRLIQISAELNNPHLQLAPSQVKQGIHAALLHGMAASAWVQRGIETGVDVWSLLEPRLSAMEAVMRRHAVLGLAGVPGPRALHHLGVLMNDPSPSVRMVSHQILYQIGTPEAKKLLDASKHLRLVPAGPFTMGRPKGFSYVLREYVINQKINFPGLWMLAWNESPAHEVDLPAFFSGRTPVTRVEYQEFIQAGGYQGKQYWTKAGWSWRVSNHRETPDLWDDEQYSDPQFPVIGVTWFEAVAYVRWAGGRLLTEAEWEKAGRGTDERHFPWGNAFDKSLCNTQEGGVGGLTPVGKYSPQGDSPYGIADLSGNVWEWTNSVYKPYPYTPDDGREDPEEGELRIPRGGSWSWKKNNVRLVCRGNDAPDYASQNMGFRCGADAEIGGVTGEELV